MISARACTGRSVCHKRASWDRHLASALRYRQGPTHQQAILTGRSSRPRQPLHYSLKLCPTLDRSPGSLHPGGGFWQLAIPIDQRRDWFRLTPGREDAMGVIGSGSRQAGSPRHCTVEGACGVHAVTHRPNRKASGGN